MALLALVAFGQTLFFAAYLRDDPGNYNGAGANGDQVAYIALGQEILRGAWAGAGHYMPGEPALVAVGQALFGDPRLGAAVLHGLVYAALVVGAAALAAAAFGAASAPWAAAFVALNPALGYYAGQALTELPTSACLFGAAACLFLWSSRGDARWLVATGVMLAGAVYVRSEYLALAPIFALVVLASGRRPAQAGLLLVVVAVLVAPWALRAALARGEPALYNVSPVSDLVLKGTWYRVFDESTFAQLETIETSPIGREEAVAAAGRVGPRPELSRRYMEQARGPYERLLGETLALAAGNVRLMPGQYLVNHALVAPILIWVGRTPLRQSDLASLPTSARYVLWGLQLVLLLLAVWQAARSLRRPRTTPLGLAFLGALAFLTLLHVLVAVDERFTAPALPLAMTFAGAAAAALVARAAPRWSAASGTVRDPA
jgi:4-amino-4-deoxy-L-arabinose transferase-like glycosyltransferase